MDHNIFPQISRLCDEICLLSHFFEITLDLEEKPSVVGLEIKTNKPRFSVRRWLITLFLSALTGITSRALVTLFLLLVASSLRSPDALTVPNLPSLFYLTSENLDTSTLISGWAYRPGTSWWKVEVNVVRSHINKVGQLCRVIESRVTGEWFTLR